MIERQSLYMQRALLEGLEAELTAQLMKQRLENCGVPFESLDTDRGTGFRETGDVMLGKAFVCNPCAPDQRGCNENQIGMLRADWPKGVSMEILTPRKVGCLKEKYNQTPRKCLGVLPPMR